VKSAAARIEEVRALVAISRAALFPQVDASVSAARTRSSTVSTRFPAGATPTNNFFAALFNTSFELDLWGRLRRATEAARAVLLSTEYAEIAVRLSMVSQIAETYFDLRSLDLQLVIARRTLVSREESLSLVRK